MRGGPVRVGLAAVVVAAFGLAACNSGPTGVEFQVIEETQFDPSLNVDLAAMTKLPEGVYIQDLVDGSGDGLANGDRAWVYYELRLANATPIANGVFDYLVGVDRLIPGWEAGVLGMMPGGTRIMLIPPELGYGATGQGAVPPGAILHFRVDLDSIT